MKGVLCLLLSVILFGCSLELEAEATGQIVETYCSVGGSYVITKNIDNNSFILVLRRGDISCGKPLRGRPAGSVKERLRREFSTLEAARDYAIERIQSTETSQPETL